MQLFRSQIALLLFSISAIALASEGKLNPYGVLVRDVVSVFGDQRKVLWSNDTLIRKAVVDSLGIPDDPSIDGQIVFLSGCRIHSCQEKGASIINTKEKRLEATSLLHYACALEILPKAELEELAQKKLNLIRNRCASKPTVSIFVIRRAKNDVTSLSRESEHVARLKAWGEKNGAAAVEIQVVESH